MYSIPALPEAMPAIPVDELDSLFETKLFQECFMYNPNAIAVALEDLAAEPETYRAFRQAYYDRRLGTADGVGRELLMRHNERFGHTSGSGVATLQMVILFLRKQINVAQITEHLMFLSEK